MRVIVGADRYAIHFRHLGKQAKRRVTVCHVVRLHADHTEIIASATATCNPHDVYRKATGRDLAFKRAMEIAGFGEILSRTARTALWRAYRLRKDATLPAWPTAVDLMEREERP